MIKPILPVVHRLILTGMQILQNDQFLIDHAVIVERGLIKGIVPANMISNHLPANCYEFPRDAYLVPGFIDLHMHGLHGFDVMDARESSLQGISQALAKEGVTGFLATTMTCENQEMEATLTAIAKSTDRLAGARLLGVHLEGPFISNEKKGAQRPSGLLPDINLFKYWQALSGQKIKIVTLAPELLGAIDFIKYLHHMDVIVSIGHTNADYEQTLLAIANGATHATHLFNAMSGIHQRQPDAAGALLLSDNIKAELIVDGIHLHPAMVQLAYRIKQKDRLFLITDSMRAKCMQAGQYELGGQMVEVNRGVAALPGGVLAGSLLRLPEAVKNMVKFTGCALPDAITMATLNPASALKMDRQKGTIAIGKDADLVVLDHDFNVMMTIREGIPIF